VNSATTLMTPRNTEGRTKTIQRYALTWLQQGFPATLSAFAFSDATLDGFSDVT
jgi:hypothetical protein